MPGMDGWAVLTALKADPELADIPVIMLTIVDDKRMGYTLGASDYLTKPIDWDRLTARAAEIPLHAPALSSVGCRGRRGDARDAAAHARKRGLGGDRGRQWA